MSGVGGADFLDIYFSFLHLFLPREGGASPGAVRQNSDQSTPADNVVKRARIGDEQRGAGSSVYSLPHRACVAFTGHGMGRGVAKAVLRCGIDG